MASVTDASREPDIEPWADPDRVASRIRLTRLERALDWASSLAPSPLCVATSCCGMSLSQAGDVFEALGSGPPAVSARSADLLIVAGSISRRQVPILLDAYERMVAPRWVLAWGACAISGGPYRNYATVHGLSRILPVDVHVRGCPPTPADFREALVRLRERAMRPRPSSQPEWLPIPDLRHAPAGPSREDAPEVDTAAAAPAGNGAP